MIPFLPGISGEKRLEFVKHQVKIIFEKIG
jgi:hypothetical protein